MPSHKFVRLRNMSEHINSIENDGGNKCHAMTERGDKMMHFELSYPMEDTGKWLFGYKRYGAWMTFTKSYKEFFSAVFKDFPVALAMVNNLEGQEKDKLKGYLSSDTVFIKRKFTLHHDKFLRNNEESLVIIEHIIAGNGWYYRVHYDNFEEFLAEFPVRTHRHRKLVQKQKSNIRWDELCGWLDYIDIDEWNADW